MIKEVAYDDYNFIELLKKLEKEHVDVVKEQRSPGANCLKNLDKYEYVLIYFDGKNAIGCLALSKAINKVVEIGRVYVLPEYRNKKIATKLFEKAFYIAKENGNRFLTLDTYERFEAAIHLYKKLGFYVVDTFEYLKHSPYSVCMKKDL